jgi:hypothetical protein
VGHYKELVGFQKNEEKSSFFFRGVNTVNRANTKMFEIIITSRISNKKLDSIISGFDWTIRNSSAIKPYKRINDRSTPLDKSPTNSLDLFMVMR